MFIRLSLLRHNAEWSVHWPRKLFETNQFRTRLKLMRNCSDIKCNEELLFSSQSSGVVIPSALKMKQTIKSGFYDCVDGFTCIQTSCPTCPPDNEQMIKSDRKAIDQTKQNDDKCLFINKTTGNSPRETIADNGTLTYDEDKQWTVCIQKKKRRIF